MKDRVSTYPGRVKLIPVAGQANVYDMVMADQPTQEGTPLNKANLLSDATAAALGLEVSDTSSPTVDQALEKLREIVVAGAKIQTGSYVGTETYGGDNPNTLTFDFEPKFVAINMDYSDVNYGGFCWVRSSSTGLASFSSLKKTVKITWSANKLSWYSSSGAWVQLNAAGYTYYYIAIG